MINILTTSFTEPLTEEVFSYYKSLLCPEMQERNEKFLFWKDKHAHLFGKLLFIEALKVIGVESDFWDYLEYNPYNRPSLMFDNYDINITHSGDFVVCAIGENTRVGIDIEEIRDVELNNFKNIMSLQKWEEINNSDDKMNAFFRYWTKMESVVKANGKGMHIPFDQLQISGHTVRCNKDLWHLTEIEIDPSYMLSLATDQLSKYELSRIVFKGDKVYLEQQPTTMLSV